MSKASKNKRSDKEIPVIQKEQGMEPVEPGHLLTPFEEMEQLFERFFPHGWMRPFDFEHPLWKELPAPFAQRMAPRVDIINREAEVIVRAQLPGVDKKDLDVSMSGNTVSIKGRTRHEEKEERGDYYRRECSSGSFTRSFVLPNEVDGSKTRATFENGVLELTIPKSTESKRRKIEID